MPAQWTAEILGKMHISGITAKQLAEEAGWNPKYLSRVMNGHVEPKGAEKKLNAALDRIITQKNAGISQAGEDAAPLRHAPHDTSPRGEASQQE